MRVLLVHDGVGPLRGSEAVMLALIAATRPRGLGWTVLTNHPEFAEAAAAGRADVTRMEFRAPFAGGRPSATLAELGEALLRLGLAPPPGGGAGRRARCSGWWRGCAGVRARQTGDPEAASVLVAAV